MLSCHFYTVWHNFHFFSFMKVTKELIFDVLHLLILSCADYSQQQSDYNAVFFSAIEISYAAVSLTAPIGIDLNRLINSIAIISPIS